MPNNKPQRQRLMAQIHIAAKELNIQRDDGDTGILSTYQHMLENQTGKTSTADMNNDELRSVMRYLRAQGFKAKPKRKRVAEHTGKPHTIGRRPRLQKIEAQLSDMGLPWSYANAIAKNITGGHGGGEQQSEGVDSLAWVKRNSELDGIIAALHVEQEKRQWLARVDELLAALGKTHNDINARKNWQRHRPTLCVLIEQLECELEKYDVPH